MLARLSHQRLLGLLTLFAIAITFFVPPIAQDPTYHAFADTRAISGIPNYWDVVSNVGFLFAGLFGLSQTHRLSSPALRPAYLVFCVGVILVAFGSGYYHYAPSTPTLVWDRLPMTIAFMALFSLVIGDRISYRLGRALLWPLLILGAASVFYWEWTEEQGSGDLRPYALVQFLPLILMPLMLLLLPGSRRSEPWLWATFAAYGLAKVTEYFDAPIYQLLGFSGHSIKHLLSALAVLYAIIGLLRLDAPQDAQRTHDLHRR